MISLKYERADILPMAECLLDLAIRTLIRRIYCSTNRNVSATLKERFSSASFDVTMNRFDQHMITFILLSKIELVRWARNYLVTLIDFRYRLIAINEINGEARSYNKQIKDVAIRFFEPFIANGLGVNRSDLKKLSVYISSLPGLLYGIAELITYGGSDQDLADQHHEKIEDVKAKFKRFGSCHNQQVGMLISFNEELSPYADYLQKLIADTIRENNEKLVS